MDSTHQEGSSFHGLIAVYRERRLRILFAAQRRCPIDVILMNIDMSILITPSDNSTTSVEKSA